jgi:hypothetical protein
LVVGSGSVFFGRETSEKAPDTVDAYGDVPLIARRAHSFKSRSVVLSKRAVLLVLSRGCWPKILFQIVQAISVFVV